MPLRPPPAVQVIREREQAAVLLQANRRKILQLLRQPNSATGLAKSLKLTRQRVNYHLRELERAGLVELVAERRARNCVERVMRASAHSYVMSPEVLEALGQQEETEPDRFSSAYLVAMAAEVIREVAVLREGASKAKKRLATLSLQVDIHFESAGQRHAFAEELAETLARLVDKYHRPDASAGRSFRVFSGAYPKPKNPHPPPQEPTKTMEEADDERGKENSQI